MVTTDTEEDGATPSDPLDTAVRPAVAGTVTISEAPTSGSPVGYTVLGYDVSITAPASTFEEPILIWFYLDDSLVPAGQDETTIQVLRNGVAVPDCNEQVGPAVPDPCVRARQVTTLGDIAFAVATSAASLWQLAVVDSYTFTGFFKPVVNSPGVNSVKAGQSVALKFSLGGNFGLNVLASASPASRQISCSTGAVLGDWVPIVSESGLAYKKGEYSISWKTAKSWANTCRELAVRLDDGSSHTAIFNFGK